MNNIYSVSLTCVPVPLSVLAAESDPDAMDNFRKEFIKGTYLVYLAAQYQHSFLKCSSYYLAGK